MYTTVVKAGNKTEKPEIIDSPVLSELAFRRGKRPKLPVRKDYQPVKCESNNDRGRRLRFCADFALSSAE